MTKKILNHIGELFPVAEHTLSKLRHSPHLERNISRKMVGSSNGEGKYQKEAPTKSFRTKFSWAFSREASFTQYVETFEVLLDYLYIFVPPDVDSGLSPKMMVHLSIFPFPI